MKSNPTRIFAVIVCSLTVGCATAPNQVSDGSNDCLDTKAVLAFAVHAIEQGENAAALAALDYVLDREPGNQKAEYYMGVVHQQSQTQGLEGPRFIFPTIPPQVVTR